MNTVDPRDRFAPSAGEGNAYGRTPGRHNAKLTEVRAGTRLVADSRGIPVPSETPLSGGYVMRLVSARQRSAATDAPDVE